MNVEVKRVWAKNFKSLKEIDLKLNQFNLIVGPNGSGKSNILELFKFISLCIRPPARPSYPFAPWWGYGNIVWKGQEDIPITFGMEYLYYGYNASYEVTVSGYGGKLTILEETLDIKNILKLVRKSKEVTLTYDDSFLSLISTNFKLPSNIPYLTPVPPLSTLVDQKITTEKIKIQKIDFIPEDISILSMVNGWSAIHSQDMKYSLGTININNNSSNIGNSFTQLVSASPLILKDFPFHSNVPLFPTILEFPGINDILFIRSPDSSSIRSADQFKNNNTLSERGEGLTNLLFTWFNKSKKLPDRIESAIKEMFPGYEITFQLTPDGRIILNVQDHGLTLQPHSIPDGFYKMLFILAAIELKPKILLIDEIENSLYASLIEYIMDSLQSCDTTVIVSTHSPVVVDLTHIEDIILTENIGLETKCRKVDNPDKLKKKLVEKGISVSESWLYGGFK
ncbi:MAG: AAA family ATPase [Thermoplasmata archaeon]